MLRGTLTPACTGSVSVVVPVGGLEWLVDCLGFSSNIAPPTSGGPISWLGLSAYEHCTPFASLHNASNKVTAMASIGLLHSQLLLPKAYMSRLVALPF